jgi:glycosyltransferase involved in cell wall biosynthesis
MEVIILFPYSWFPQTPTVMGLYKELKQKGDVKILTLYNESRGSILDNPDFIYLNRYTNRFNKYFLRFVSYISYQFLKILWILYPRKFRKYKILTVELIRLSLRMHFYLKKKQDYHVIAVDPDAAFFCQLKNLKYHFLSTELQKDRLRDMMGLKSKNIKSIIIQTQRRFDMLTIPGKEHISNKFFIQNAPNFEAPARRTVASKKLIFAGAIWEGFGVVYCMEFIKKYKEFCLALKGTPQCDLELYKKKYFNEIREGRIRIDTSYSDTATFNEILSACSIGFSFYDESHPLIRESIEHYVTAPSGKMFTYFSLGIPVIGSKGLSEINDFEAGVTIKNYSPESIYDAVQTILSDYKRYSDNALKAAAYYSFDTRSKPFVEFLANE